MKYFDVAKVADPAFFSDNCIQAHSDHVCYPSQEAMERGENPCRVSLNGLWRFSYAKNMALAVPNFEAEDYDCSGWDEIRVPAHIQMEGHDAPAYVNVEYPWDGREDIAPGEIPREFNPVASYVTYFDVPEGWRGQRVCVSFQGVESAMALWCNGSYVGYCEDSFTPSEFDLTPYIRERGNKLAARVFKWCSGSWCESQDFFRFSGIFRDVCLYMTPGAHVEDIDVRTLLSEDFAEAELSVVLRVRGRGQVRAALYAPFSAQGGREELCQQADVSCAPLQSAQNGCAPDILRWGVCVGEESIPCSIENTCCQEEAVDFAALEGLGRVEFALHVHEPLLWSCEKPFLYRLLLTVTDEAGRECEAISQMVGVRDFRLRDSILYLNGKRIVFHGVNRHEFSSLTGRAISREETLQDIFTMKRNNINAIRTSHYPNASYLYELCDAYGIYVIDEANMESHGNMEAVMRGLIPQEEAVPGDDMRFREAMLDRVRSIYQRDKNHACVLIWSIGNESYGGTVPLAMGNLFRELDGVRPVHYEGTYLDPRYPETTDIYSRMYPKAADIRTYLAEHRDKPYLCCEYAHSMGNSTGALHKYTELAYEEELYHGGFIWDYIDQSLTKKDRYGREFQAYGGDHGERPTDYNFSGNGIVYGEERAESPKMQEVKFCYQQLRVYVGKTEFQVENRHMFTDASAFRCLVTLKKDGRDVERQEVPVSVPPRESRAFEMPVKIPTAPGDYVIHVSFQLREDTDWARAGYEVAFGETDFVIEGVSNLQRGLREPYHVVSQLMEKMAFRMVRGVGYVGVMGEHFSALFSGQRGGMVSYRYGGRELIEDVPMPNFWRAPVDNDCGNGMMQRYGQWKLASMYASPRRARLGFCDVGADGNMRRGGQNDPICDDGAGEEREFPQMAQYEDHVELRFAYDLPTAPASSCCVTYVITPDGAVAVTLSYDPVEGLGAMPEFGMMFRLSRDFDRVQWYGNGPMETYADRKHGASLGIYGNRVEDNLAKYLVPQECGNKTEVRWGRVCDARGRGILFAAERAMNFSALPYTPHELELARHAYELPRPHYTVVRVSSQQMGVGGDDSWGAPVHPEYLVDVSGRMEFTFSFRGI